MEYVKNFLPYVVSIFTAWLAYKEATKKYKLELDKLERNYKNELEKLLKQSMR